VKTVSDRFNSTFFRLLSEGNGQITLLQFAKETQLSIEEARQFLDEKAQEFNATFDTDEKGGISYYFNS
jgi:large subunit ribosomal protein L7/L12